MVMKGKKNRITLRLLDVTLLLISFSIAVVISPYSGISNIREFDAGLSISVIVWLIVSSLTSKVEAGRFIRFRRLVLHILLTNMAIGLICALLLFSFKSPQYSIFIVYAALVSTTLLEVIVGSFLYSVKNARTFPETIPLHVSRTTDNMSHSPSPNPFIGLQDASTDLSQEIKIPKPEKIDQALIDEAGNEVYQFINSHIDLNNGSSIVFSTTSKFNIVRLPRRYYTNLVNLKRINDIRHINKFFEAVNVKIPRKGIFIGCAETQELRKQRLLNKYPPGLNIIYYMMDFVLKRIFPKFQLTKRIYFYLTKGRNRVISRAEVLGRLYCCGFEVQEETFIDGYFYFVASKEKQPTYDFHPTYGPFIKLGRTGKDGRIIKVFKIRTMHPYSEYLQEYVYTHHYLKEGGKFNNDFRISTCGKFLRKFWLDEVLMIINLFKGDMKLVGVRPLSIHYFNLYTEELQRKRIQFKPGLIPPFYADLPKTLEEIMASEMKYLKEYEKHPIRTDIKYFFLALYNIVLRNSRSN